MSGLICMKSILILIGLTSVSAVTTGDNKHGYNNHMKGYYSQPYYSYAYAVNNPYTQTDFGHEETRHGESTKGQYQVLLPDGRRQIVTYYVDGPSGFVADIKYVGEAKFENYKPAYAAPFKVY